LVPEGQGDGLEFYNDTEEEHTIRKEISGGGVIFRCNK